MRAEAQSVVDRSRTVLVKCFSLVGDLRQIVVGLFLGAHGAPEQEGRSLVQDTRVAGCGDVSARRVRQPKIIVGKVRPHAAPGGRMPPMLYVAIGELSPRSAKKMLS